MDAEVDEDPELSPSPSVVMESVRSRVDDEVDDCASASVAGTERPASCWLMPFCACET